MSGQPDLEHLLQAVESLRSFEFKDAADRRRAMLALRHVSDDLQHPFDKILEMWGAPAKDAALKTCLDVDLFNKWRRAGTTKTASELADLTGVQPDLMTALLKHLATWHIIREEGPNAYSLTEFALQLTSPEIAASVDLHFDAMLPTFSRLPVYLGATQYVRPTNQKWAPLSYAMNFHGDFFEYMAMNRHCGEALDRTMKGYAQYRGSWLDVFPGEELIRGADAQQPLVVDVGGGLGHDLEKFIKRFPSERRDRLILQEQEHVIDKVDPGLGIKMMRHDFLAEQPVRGARAYYLHQILHDWPDSKCRVILDSIRAAMGPGSRILINEMVVPSVNASMGNTCFDMIMLAMSGGRERDEETWLSFLESAGLRVVKIWTSGLATEAVIECVPK